MARVLLLILFCCASMPCCAVSEEEIPLDLQLQIFLKIMTYNRTLSFDKLDSFAVTIAYNKAAGKQSLEELSARIKDILGGKTILGRPITLNIVAIGKAFKTSALNACHLLILHGELDEEKASLLAWANERKVLSAAAMHDADVSDVVILLRLEDQKPVIHFNLGLARKLGFDFHAQFLKHCIITK